MVKEPTTTKLGNAAFSRMPGVLRPEDVLSDPEGETVFIPPPERLFGLFQPRQLVLWRGLLRRDRVKMKQKSGSCKTTSDKVVNDIHRATRTRH
jgi:hypothetical protein